MVAAQPDADRSGSQYFVASFVGKFVGKLSKFDKARDEGWEDDFL